MRKLPVTAGLERLRSGVEITALARYPVKSMGGEPCGRLSFDERGVVGDRVWAVRTADGGIGSGKTTRRFRRLVGLLDCSAVLTELRPPSPPTHGAGLSGVAVSGAAGSDLGWAAGEVVGSRPVDGTPLVTLPDGSCHAADSPDLADRLSALLGQPVTLAVEGDVPHHDDAPVHVLSTLELVALGDRLGEPVDPRRVRANVLVDGPVTTGMRLALEDGPVLVVRDPMPRCVMVTMAQDVPGRGRIADDRRVLKAATGAHGPELGFMATVERGGAVAVGGRVQVLPA